MVTVGAASGAPGGGVGACIAAAMRRRLSALSHVQPLPQSLNWACRPHLLRPRAARTAETAKQLGSLVPLMLMWLTVVRYVLMRAALVSCSGRGAATLKA